MPGDFDFFFFGGFADFPPHNNHDSASRTKGKWLTGRQEAVSHICSLMRLKQKWSDPRGLWAGPELLLQQQAASVQELALFPPGQLIGAPFSRQNEGQHGSLEIQITNVEVREVTFTAGSHVNTGAAAQSFSRAE